MLIWHMPECCSCAVAHARQGEQLFRSGLHGSRLLVHLQHLGREIARIGSVCHVLCVGHDKSARLVSSEERTHFKSRTGVPSPLTSRQSYSHLSATSNASSLHLKPAAPTCHGQRTALAARSRSHRLNGRGAAGARAGYSATNSTAKAALLVEHEQWRNCSIPASASNRSTRCLHCVARLSRIATCVSWQFEAFVTRTSVGNIYMFRGDKQRTQSICGGAVPFVCKLRMANKGVCICGEQSYI